jgi:OmcA/MtrC family decaheme c-type cytochrome
MESNLEAHTIPGQAASKTVQYNVLAVTNTNEGDSPVITFSITDPTNDDAPYDLTTHPSFSGASDAGVYVSLMWPNSDFTNVANDDGTDVTGRPAAQSRRISVIPGSGTELPTGVMDNGDGTYTLDTGMLNPPVVIPSTTPPLGSGSVLVEGHPGGDFSGVVGVFDDSFPVTSALVPFAINDAEPMARRVVVSLEKCQDCHNVNDGLAFHGGNRSDNNEACASCHNPNSTDLFRRPIDPDGVANGFSEATVDGLEEASVSYAYMIHAIHSPDVRETEYTAYGFGGTAHSYGDLTYPGRQGDCLACHVEGTYYGAPEGALGTTVNTGATVVDGSRFGASAYAPSTEVATNWNDDNKFSPQAAACVACHDSDIAIEHMSVRGESGISFGNSFLDNQDPFGDPDTQERLNNAGPENCVFCHGQGAFADVDSAHGLND